MAYRTCTSTLSSYMHKHRLTLVDFMGHYSGHVCDVCSHRVNSLVYQCKACKFYVHPRCTLIAKKLMHTLHPDHQLVLQPSTTLSCAICHGACSSWLYSCKSCGFHIHPSCASNSNMDIHAEAPGTPQRVQADQVPRGYASETSAPQGYLMGHQIISPTSSATRQTTQSVQAEVPRGYARSTSAPQVNPTRVATTLTPQRVQAEVPRGYASVTSSPKDNPIAQKITCPTKATLSSYMHKHTLALVDYTAGRSSRVCDVCNKKVNELVYQCRPCGFDVHRLCTLLPHKLRHALHPNHQLVLQPSTTNPCAVCRRACTSWRYSCKSCGFHIHPECVLETSRHSNSDTNNRAAATLTPQPVQVKVPRGCSTSVTIAPQTKLNPQRVQAEVPQGYSTGVTSAPQDYFNYFAPNGNVSHYYYSQYSNSGNYPLKGNGGTADNLSGYGGKVMYDIVQDLASGVISDVIFGALNLDFS